MIKNNKIIMDPMTAHMLKIPSLRYTDKNTHL